MQTKPHIANSKIIILIAFVCAALMTSLFIFHLSHPNKRVDLADNAGTLFPVPRDIKPFKLTTAENQPFNQQQLLGKWTLLFFGFSHCSSICPLTLTMLNAAYNKLHQEFPNMQIVFITLDPERDTLNDTVRYTKSFNPNFIGVTGKLEEIHKLQSQLGVFAIKDESPASDYQIQHTASVLLINPQGKMAGLFNANLNTKQFVEAYQTSMQIFARDMNVYA